MIRTLQAPPESDAAHATMQGILKSVETTCVISDDESMAQAEQLYVEARRRAKWFADRKKETLAPYEVWRKWAREVSAAFKPFEEGYTRIAQLVSQRVTVYRQEQAEQKRLAEERTAAALQAQREAEKQAETIRQLKNVQEETKQLALRDAQHRAAEAAQSASQHAHDVVAATPQTSENVRTRRVATVVIDDIQLVMQALGQVYKAGLRPVPEALHRALCQEARLITKNGHELPGARVVIEERIMAPRATRS